MLSFAGVALRRGPKELFSGASFTIHPGEKVGLVGANGSGKSSLMSLVLGEIHADSGEVSLAGGIALAHVAQQQEITDRPAIEFVIDGDEELRSVERSLEHADGVALAQWHARFEEIGGHAANARAARLLRGLGFAADQIERPLASFSGGWRMRLAIARTLMCRSQLLLLDEPTNHLDLDAIIWLEDWLRHYQGGLLLVSHDREFMDNIATRVLAIEHGRIDTYRGNYSAFETQRAARLAGDRALALRQRRQVAHIEDFVRRFRAKASKARQVQSRLRTLEKMQMIVPAQADSPFEFAFQAPDRLPRPLMTLDDAYVGYSGRPVLRGVGLTIYPGERIALLGRNGAGKSTLMKLLGGSLATLGGTRLAADGVEVGYFAQHQLEQLDGEATSIETLRRIAPEFCAPLKEQEERAFLGRFGFTDERVFEPIANFSGGEKARLVLAVLAAKRPNLLLLDEPTNHLDLQMRQALSIALQDYPGAVVVVSHDRHLLRGVADRLLIVRDARVEDFDGDLDDYAQWLARAASDNKGAAPASAGGGRREQRRIAASRRADMRPLRQAQQQAEDRTNALGRELMAIEQQLASQDVYAASQRARLLELQKEQARLRAELDAAETQWLEATEALERQAR
ncbi:MAG: ATP-binding cassette domain-containing protein [Steroidobacteraceae bacterium]